MTYLLLMVYLTFLNLSVKTNNTTVRGKNGVSARKPEDTPSSFFFRRPFVLDGLGPEYDIRNSIQLRSLTDRPHPSLVLTS